MVMHSQFLTIPHLLCRNVYPCDGKIHYDGVPAKLPYAAYPKGIPDTFTIRRFQMDRVLQSLLMEHAQNTVAKDAIVRQVVLSEDKSQITSIVMRDNTGKNVTINDVDLVVGESFLLCACARNWD